MTTPTPRQPRRAPEERRYNPITLEQLNNPSGSVLTRPISSFFSGSLSEPVGELSGPVARSLAVPLFAFILFYTQRTPFVAPLLILVLLGCLISRMEGSVRQVAAIPLSLSAVKLCFSMMTYLENGFSSHALQNNALQNNSLDPGLYWLPIFFSACLAFIRNKETVTFRLIFVGSCVLLASGLLPSIAFIAVFYMLDVVLFFGVVIAVFFDLLPYLQNQPGRSSAAARQA
jgi:hypothetical protein